MAQKSSWYWNPVALPFSMGDETVILKVIVPGTAHMAKAGHIFKDHVCVCAY